MKEHTETASVFVDKSLFRRWWESRTFIQQRLIRFCFSILVMVVCFPLYYMGFFGTVEGPLHPARFGEALAGLGVTRTHCLMVFLSILIISASWNWIYNLVSLISGARLSCVRSQKGRSVPCGLPARREKAVDPKTGKKKAVYFCEQGHRQPEAHFHPIRKGTISHTLWLISLSFCVIILFMG